MITETNRTPCRACGHNDSHTRPLLFFTGRSPLPFCAECLELRRFCTDGMRDYAALADSRATTIAELRDRAERAEAHVTELQESATKRVIEWREERHSLQNEIARLRSGAVLYWNGKPSGFVESLSITTEKARPE